MLSNDLTSFLIDFSIALQKHAIYPAGHPSLAPAARRLAELAGRLLDSRPALAFGVARHQLIIDGVATDAGHPVLRRLAETLHQHHLGAITILPGVEAEEMAGAFNLLAVDVGPHDIPLGLAPPASLPSWPHLRLHPLTLDRLEVLDEASAPSDQPESQAARRAAQLWIGLANAALQVDCASPASDDGPPDPTVVAKAIDEHADTAAYDQVIVGYLLQIAEELKTASAADHGALRRRTTRLIGALRPETLRRLVTMGGNMTQRRAFVIGATSGMAVESVVRILTAAADASGQTISHGLVRMLSKLATHAGHGPGHTRPIADLALREQVERLLAGWDLSDPAPSTYARTLQNLATAGTRSDGSRPTAPDSPAIMAMQIVQTGLEVGSSGPLLERAVDRAVAGGQIQQLVALLSSLPPECPSEAADVLRRKLGGATAATMLLANEPLDVRTLDAILPLLTRDGYAALLDVLITSESRATRRKLLERLAPTHLEVASLIAARLHDDRWYVQRNLLLLLERLEQVPPGFSAAEWAQHHDPRVRYQGIALQLKMQDERRLALRAALEDNDERIAHLGLLAAQDACPPPLIPLLAHFATSPRVREDLRVLAVHALARTRDRYALDTLIRLAEGDTTMFGRLKLPPAPVVAATLRALSDCWPGHATVVQLLARARRSSAPQLRDAVKAITL